MKPNKPFNATMFAGMVMLVVANLGSYWLRTRSGWPEDLVDGASGFLMGVAIATLLVGLVTATRGLPRRCR